MRRIKRKDHGAIKKAMVGAGVEILAFLFAGLLLFLFSVPAGINQ